MGSWSTNASDWQRSIPHLPWKEQAHLTPVSLSPCSKSCWPLSCCQSLWPSTCPFAKALCISCLLQHQEPLPQTVAFVAYQREGQRTRGLLQYLAVCFSFSIKVAKLCSSHFLLKFIPHLVSFLLLWKNPNKKQLREGKGLFGLQLHITVHHLGKGKAGTRAASHSTFKRRKKQMHTHASCWLVASFLKQSRAWARPRGWCHLQWDGSTSNQDNSTDMPTGLSDLNNSWIETLLGCSKVMFKYPACSNEILPIAQAHIKCLLLPEAL